MITAIEAYSIAPSSSDANGATSASSRAAGGPGAATMTRSVSTVSGSRVEPTVSRKPVAVRSIRRTAAEVRISTPEVSARASGSRPTPPTRPANIGGTEDGGGGSAATAASKEPCSRTIATTWGTVADADRWSA